MGRLLKYSLPMFHDPTLQALLDEAIEFPWQQTLLEALIERYPDYLPGKNKRRLWPSACLKR